MALLCCEEAFGTVCCRVFPAAQSVCLSCLLHVSGLTFSSALKLGSRTFLSSGSQLVLERDVRVNSPWSHMPNSGLGTEGVSETGTEHVSTVHLQRAGTGGGPRPVCQREWLWCFLHGSSRPTCWRLEGRLALMAPGPGLVTPQHCLPL